MMGGCSNAIFFFESDIERKGKIIKDMLDILKIVQGIYIAVLCRWNGWSLSRDVAK